MLEQYCMGSHDVPQAYVPTDAEMKLTKASRARSPSEALDYLLQIDHTDRTLYIVLAISQKCAQLGRNDEAQRYLDEAKQRHDHRGETFMNYHQYVAAIHTIMGPRLAKHTTDSRGEHEGDEAVA